MISPSEYDKLLYTQSFSNSISERLEDSEKGNVVTTSELREALIHARAKR